MTATPIPQDVLDELAAYRASTLDPNMAPCPEWCTLDAGHPWDSTHDNGRSSRGHAGPSFGESVSVGSSEFADAIGVQHYDVSVDPEVETRVSSVSEALELARCLLEAAGWVLAVREGEQS